MKRGLFLLSWCSAALLTGCGGGGSGAGGYASSATDPLNDTGITLCGDYAFPDSTHNNNVNCNNAGATQTVDGVEVVGGSGSDPVPAGQDAVYGRDADVYTDSPGDGFKGFELTKLGADGVALAEQDAAWSDGGSESAGTRWSCVRDEVTGLVWEVKTNDNGLRDRDYTYTWYDSNATTNGGNAGTGDSFGIGVGSDNCYVDTRCDTAKYVQDVNAFNFCGSNTWRLPSRDELKTLRHLGIDSPAIEQAYFPNTPAANFWTSTPRADGSTYAWVVDFIDGSEQPLLKNQAYAVRLVRDAN